MIKLMDTTLIGTNKYNVTNAFYSHIYDLVVNECPTGVSYSTSSMSESIDQIYILDSQKSYEKFGYYFGEYSTYIFPDPEWRLLIVPFDVLQSLDTFVKFIDSQDKNTKYTHIIFEETVIIDEDTPDYTRALDLLELLKVYSDLTGTNPILFNDYPIPKVLDTHNKDVLSDLANSSVKGMNSNFIPVDITNEILASKVYSSDYSVAINAVLDLIDRLGNRPFNIANIYYIDDDKIASACNNNAYSIQQIKAVFVIIAAYCNLKYGHTFYFNSNLSKNHMEGYVRNMLSPIYNTLDNYINNIKLPFLVGVSSNNHIKYIHTLDRNEFVKNIKGQSEVISDRLTLTMYACRFDINSKSLDTTKELLLIRSPLNDIVPINFRTLFNTASEDKLEALGNEFSLNNILSEFEKMVHHGPKGSTIGRSVIFNLFNCMFFSYGGDTYFGYKIALDGSYPYKTKPLNYAPFENNIPVIRLRHEVLPTTLVYGNEAMFGNLASNSKPSVFLPDTAKGIVLRIFNNKAFTESQLFSVNLTVDQIGCWNHNCYKMRTYLGEKLANNMSPASLRTNGITGAYGSKHPCRGLGASINMNSWREF